MKVSTQLLRVTAIVLFLQFSLTSFAQVSTSPVGTWELSVTRKNSPFKETGTAFVTFNSDRSLTGYGVTTATFSVFTLSGTWDYDAYGRVVASYTEYLDGQTLNGTILGKAKAGKSFQANVSASNGSFLLKGKPSVGTPSLSGNWQAVVKQGGYTVAEYFEISPLGGYPGVFIIEGYGSGPSGAFTVEGAAVLNAKGQITAYAFSDFEQGGMAAVYLKGKLNSAKQTATLSGSDTQGLRLSVKLMR